MNYSIFQAPIFSFFSKSYYGYLARKGKGTGILYLFVLLLVCYPLHLISVYVHFFPVIDSAQVEEISKTMPDIQIKNGKLSISKASPYRMKIHNSLYNEDKVILFDTSGAKIESDDADLILSQDGIQTEPGKSPIPWSMPTFGNDFSLQASGIKDALNSISLFLALLCLALFPLVWLGHVVLALIYGVVGLFMDRHKLGFATAMRMAAIAMTPTIVVSTLLNVFFIRPELWELITVPITLGYLFFAYSSVESN